jgi:hypothetical protein
MTFTVGGFPGTVVAGQNNRANPRDLDRRMRGDR